MTNSDGTIMVTVTAARDIVHQKQGRFALTFYDSRSRMSTVVHLTTEELRRTRNTIDGALPTIEDVNRQAGAVTASDQTESIWHEGGTVHGR